MTGSDTIRRPGFITFLAVLNLAGGAGWAVLTAVCLFVAASGSADLRTLFQIGAAICAVFAGLHIAAGIGLLTLRPYGRILQIIIAVPFLLNIPFGTAISILLFIYLGKPGIKLMFSGRHASELSAEERNAVNADSGLPGVAVALIVLIAIVPVMSFIVIPVISAIAIPGLLRARMTANEASAIAAMEQTVSAQVVYAATCGKGGYATSYLVLGTPVEPGTGPLISGELGSSATPQKEGYNFILQAGAGSQPGPPDCQGRSTVTAFYASAVPQTFRSTGMRSFAANDRDGIWQDTSETPPAEPFGPPAMRVRDR